MNDPQNASLPIWVAAHSVWLRPDDGDQLFGIEGIARYLALPFLDVRTMISLGQLPTWKVGRSHVCRRTALVSHFAATEAASASACVVAQMPVDIWPDGSLGIVSGPPAIAAHLGMTVESVRYHRLTRGLPVFRFGKVPFARRASLDRWAAAQTDGARRARRRVSRLAARQAAAPAGAIVGAVAIAVEAGCTIRTAQMAIYHGSLPVQRTGRGIWAHAADVARYAERRRARSAQQKEAQHGVS